jgi:hypothetical protein
VGVKVASRLGAMFQYQGTDSSRPLVLSSPMVGGSQPDWRASLSGKRSEGTGRMGTPLKSSTAPSAWPTSSSRSSVSLSARRIQSGTQSGPGRTQVV